MILLFFIPLISAQPPFEQEAFSGSNGFIIEYPFIKYVKQYEDMNFSFHLFNASNGNPIIPNNIIECNFHIYNHSGVYQYELNDYKGNLGESEWYIFIDGNNFSEQGIYSYVFYCNSSSYRGGYIKINYEVTPDGTEIDYNDSTTSLGIVLFLILINLGIFMLSFKEKYHKDLIANLIIKRSLVALGIYFLMFNFQILITLAEGANLGIYEDLFRYVWFFGWTGYVFLFILVIGTFFQALKMWKTKADEARMGGGKDE